MGRLMAVARLVWMQKCYNICQATFALICFNDILFPGTWDWNWRTLEQWSGHLPQAFGPDESPPGPHHSLGPSLERHAHVCGHACLRSVTSWPTAFWLPQHWGQHPFHQRDPRGNPQPPPLQPTACLLLRRTAWTWPSPMHIRGPPAYKWPASCQLPGGWPVKQSKKVREKKQNHQYLWIILTHVSEIFPT